MLAASENLIREIRGIGEIRDSDKNAVSSQLSDVEFWLSATSYQLPESNSQYTPHISHLAIHVSRLTIHQLTADSFCKDFTIF